MRVLVNYLVASSAYQSSLTACAVRELSFEICLQAYPRLGTGRCLQAFARGGFAIHGRLRNKGFFALARLDSGRVAVTRSISLRSWAELDI